MKKKLIYILLLLFISSIATAATKICDEDFESVTPGSIPQNDPTGTGQISEVGRPLYGSGGDGAFLGSGGNPGQHVRAYIQSATINGDSYTEPKIRFDSKLNGTELYIKFDLKIDNNLGVNVANREVTDFKFVMITDSATAATSVLWKCYLQVNPTGSYSWYAWGGDEYYFANATTNNSNLQMWDHNWHTYEVYIKIGTYVTSGDKNDTNNDGVVRMWEDGVLMLEDTKVPIRNVSDHYVLKSTAFISHAFSLGAPVTPMAGNIYYDNVEVWDGMPDAYYISTTGSNSNNGSFGAPWATFSYALGQMSGGDTLYVRAGNYDEKIQNNVPSGSGPAPQGGTWPNATTIKAYNGETVWLKPSTDSGNGSGVISLQNGSFQYIVFDGINIDAGGRTRGMDCVYLKEGPSYIKFMNMELKNGAGGVLQSYNTSPCEYINLKVHHNGDDAGAGEHGFYITGKCLIDGCEIYENADVGVVLHNPKDGNGCADSIVRNSISHDNGFYASPYGGNVSFHLGSGSNIKIYNCISYGDRHGIRFSSNNGRIYNNTVYNNTDRGIFVEGTNATIINNIAYQNGTDLYDGSSGSTWSNNLTSNPSFVNASDPDGTDNIFRTSDDGLNIQTGSAAKDAGTANVGGLFSDDIIGTTRPQGSAWDIGAYEFVEAGAPDTESPSAVSSLSGVADSETQITLSWTQATDNVGVTYNRIYRDTSTNQIAQIAANTSYTSTGLASGVSYDFWVSAVDSAANEGAKVGTTTATLADTVKPTITNTIAASQTTIEVTFSEEMDTTSVQTASNYSVDGGIGTPTSATISVDLKKVTLTVSSLSETSYTITINNVKDVSGNTILADSTDTFSWSSGLIMHFPFNSSEGQTPLDAIGNSTATLGADSGAGTDDPIYVTGKIGEALQFDGVNDLVKLVNDSRLDSMKTFTITAWINITSWGGGGFGRVISKEASGSNDVYINVKSPGDFGGEIYNTSLNNFLFGASDANFDFAEWHKIWIEYDDAGDRKVKLYWSFNEVFGYTYQDTLTGTYRTTSNPFHIGNKSDGTRGFDGIIDEVKIWNRILTAQEKEDDYDLALSNPVLNYRIHYLTRKRKRQ